MILNAHAEIFESDIATDCSNTSIYYDGVPTDKDNYPFTLKYTFSDKSGKIKRDRAEEKRTKNWNPSTHRAYKKDVDVKYLQGRISVVKKRIFRDEVDGRTIQLLTQYMPVECLRFDLKDVEYRDGVIQEICNYLLRRLGNPYYTLPGLELKMYVKNVTETRRGFIDYGVSKVTRYSEFMIELGRTLI